MRIYLLWSELIRLYSLKRIDNNLRAYHFVPYSCLYGQKYRDRGATLQLAGTSSDYPQKSADETESTELFKSDASAAAAAGHFRALLAASRSV